MDKKILGLAVVVLITFFIFGGYAVLNSPINRFTRASLNLVPSSQTSLIFAWPLETKADGKLESEITVFVRNDDEKGVPNQSVRLGNTLGTVREQTLETGEDGKTVFHISSSQKGVSQIDAYVNNIKIDRSISVKFN